MGGLETGWKPVQKSHERGRAVTVMTVRRGCCGGMVGTDRTAITNAGFGLRRLQRSSGLYRFCWPGVVVTIVTMMWVVTVGGTQASWKTLNRLPASGRLGYLSNHHPYLPYIKV